MRAMLARRGFLRGVAGALASPLVTRPAVAALSGPRAQLRRVAGAPRTHVLFVVIDRPEDAQIAHHGSNIEGLSAAVRAFDPALRVLPVTIGELAGTSARTLDAAFAPLAIIGAGSFTEWHQYGLDPRWKRDLDAWMALVRATTTPMLAICGSHQLVALAFNGFDAVAHMNDNGPPIRISEELALPTPRGLWPAPRVGEEGTYPLAPTTACDADPLARALARELTRAPMAASHHKDMVVDTTGFTLLLGADEGRAARTTAGDQARARCRVQALRLDDPGRILYSTQFHPEMAAFDESTESDGGFGAAWLTAFLALARGWWGARTAPPCDGEGGVI